MSNLDIWERFADIDPKFTKPITGKPYKGTSPNPHYVIKCLTEMFGPAGVGFGWEVVAEGFQPMGEELLHWCRIRFWHSDGKGFDAYGQTKAVMKTKSGFMNDEDAPKKSLTDAITKAAAQVGVASNIFLGRWDDNKYVAEVNTKFRDDEKQAEPFNAPATRDRIKAAIGKAANAIALEQLWTHPKTCEAFDQLPPPMQAELTHDYTARMGAVYQAPPEAAE
jgi:hypothetical protein